MVWLMVGLGGALGSLARHGLNRVIHQAHLSGTFPTGIFVINVLGSGAIGLLAGLIASGRLHLSFEARTLENCTMALSPSGQKSRCLTPS